MRIFLAGGSGAIGRRLIPMLCEAGHEVTATTRSGGKLDTLRALGARPVLLEALDREAVHKAVIASKPEVVMHQMTDLANLKDFRHLERDVAATNRLRTEGTQTLLDAAKAAGAKRFIAQGNILWSNQRTGSRVKTEEDPLDDHPLRPMKAALDAMRELERTVSTARGMIGIVLRYGSFYGPGTSIAPGGDVLEAVRARKIPIIGSGAGVWSWVHIDDAARATVLAINARRAGVYNIVDDEPAEVSAWLPDLAAAIRAKPPRHIPAWLGRLFVGEAGLCMMTQIRGSSNAKAKATFGWRPQYQSWRTGFREGLVVSEQVVPPSLQTLLAAPK